MIAADTYNQDVVVLVSVGGEIVPNPLRRQVGIDQPCAVEVVPPDTATLDCFVQLIVVLTRLVQVIG